MLTQKEVADVIIRIVNERPGIKVMELIPLLPIQDMGDVDISAFITGMAMAELIVEVEYVLPNTNRVKSILFPAGTEVS